MLGDSTNRRQYVRIPFEEVIACDKVPLAVEDTVPDTHTKNISAGGILITGKGRYDIGDVLSLRVRILGLRKYRSDDPTNDSSADVIAITGTVVRVEVVSENTYDIGVAYSEISETDRCALDLYIQKEVNK